MLVPFLTARRRRKLLDRPMDEAAERALNEQVALYKRLPDAARKKLRDFARVLVAEKHWEPCGELRERAGGLTPAMKMAIAAQAGVLLLGLGLDPLRDELYPNVESVLVYPAGFTSSGPRAVAPVGPVAVMSENFACLGEAWHQGPVILSWADAKRGGVDGSDGHNVVIHEFAHKLDMLDGAVNGTPLLESREQLDDWKNVMTGEFIALGRASALGMPTVLNPYGATNPGEFFAVASEAFFERPQELRAQHGRLYDALKGYYKQDPAGWGAAAA